METKISGRFSSSHSNGGDNISYRKYALYVLKPRKSSLHYCWNVQWNSINFFPDGRGTYCKQPGESDMFKYLFWNIKKWKNLSACTKSEPEANRYDVIFPQWQQNDLFLYFIFYLGLDRVPTSPKRMIITYK